MTREIALFKNGARFWLRLPLPGAPRVSTGTVDAKTARRIADMVSVFADGPLRPWLLKVESGLTTLAEVYSAHSTGSLGVLAATLDAALISDPDLDPVVQKWIDERVKVSTELGEATKADYARQIRAFIPRGVRFPASSFNEDVLSSILAKLVDARSGEPLSGSTKRRYIAPLRLFSRYARKRVKEIPANPFEDADWLPANNPASLVYWEHAVVLKVLGHMTGAAQLAMALVFGSGIELGALLAMKASDVRTNRVIRAPGSKADDRRDRLIYVDQWAWGPIRAHADTLKRHDALFSFASDGGDLRDAFYLAQVAAGVTQMPGRSESGKLLWSSVHPHTIHEGRHSYCYSRLLGDDGEPRQSTKFCAHQLGHATEQMVMVIYGKCNMSERIRRLEISEARAEGRTESIA